MYLLSYFRTEAEALHLALSEDGLRWRAIDDNRPVWWSSVGARSVRDPFIARDQVGRFHLFATNGWQADSILHAVSRDLRTWSDEELIPVMAGVAGVRNCWAPECFYDHHARRYQLIWSSSITDPSGRDDWNHRIWGTTTEDFRDYTAPRLFFDPGYSVIDATVTRRDDGLLMVFKDERGENRIGTSGKALHACFAPRADGPWSEVSAPITPPLTEGPALFRRDGRLILLFDHFMEGFYAAMESADGVRWMAVTDALEFPPGPRHASVIEVDASVAEGLLREMDNVVASRALRITPAPAGSGQRDVSIKHDRELAPE